MAKRTNFAQFMFLGSPLEAEFGVVLKSDEIAATRPECSA